VTPIALDEVRRIFAREVNRHNAETGRRGQRMRGRSYREVFEAGVKLRTRRVATARQLYLAGLIDTPVAVDRRGRVSVDGWTYGDPETQDALLPYHGDKQRILPGRNPDDFDQPALACDAAGNLICEGILPVKASACGSVAGIRTASRNRKAVNAATRRLDEAETFMDTARFKELTDGLPDPGPLMPAPTSVCGRPVRQHAEARAPGGSLRQDGPHRARRFATGKTAMLTDAANLDLVYRGLQIGLFQRLP